VSAYIIAMLESAVFRALSDPTRRAVFERLSRQEMNVSELKSGFHISQPAISQHLTALKGAGLVCERREGRHVYYRSDPQGLAPLADWVQRHRELWPVRIEKLKRVLKDLEP
jgi:DNA-binding transcriptional ArsR family regulator